MKYPIMSTPELVVNEKLVVSGRIPSTAAVTTFLVKSEQDLLEKLCRKRQ